MNDTKRNWWEHFQKNYTEYPTLGLALDLSRMNIPEDYFQVMESRMQTAFTDMDALERGAIANPDEKRMVGQYWLRNPAIAPSPAIRAEIENAINAVKDFTRRVHEGSICGAGGPFKNFLLIGIGGSALGPQFVAHALENPLKDNIHPFFLDNTDPDGIARVFERIGSDLSRTLCIVISKSGTTPETRNGMIEAKAAYETAALDFGRHAVAVTQPGSHLDKFAEKSAWLARFPMWDWVGGRTSVTSVVGLLPASLQGIDLESFISGSKACDDVTRVHDIKTNPSARLAMALLHSVNDNGTKNLVVLPYKDHLELFSRYLQQLIMESIGKEKDLSGNIVNQGITVLGNKGSTDQHSYIQQLRDGLDNFFATFIEILRGKSRNSAAIDRNITSGDFLTGFLYGTRSALYEKGRQSITITIQDISPFSIGVLIALFERTVGLYSSLIQINAYHQPGVEAGKEAASRLIDLQAHINEFLDQNRCCDYTVADIARGLDTDDIEHVFKLCEHMAANSVKGIIKNQGNYPFDAVYRHI